MNKMTIKKPGVLLAVAFVATVGVPLATAQTTTFTMLGNPGGVEGPAMGGVYTSPYFATVGSSTIPVICDDFVDNTYFSESWNAYDTTLAQINAGGTSDHAQFVTGGSSISVLGGPSLDQSQAYTVAAYLAVEILETNQSTSAGQEAAGDLSYALWGLFDPTVFTYTGPANSCEGCIGTTDLGYAEADLQAAVAAVKPGTLTATNFDSVMGVNSVNIYTYASCPAGDCPSQPQEFIAVSMPEPYSPTLLGLDLLGAAGLIFFVRRRRRESL
jgi:hypothetical protein